MDGSLGRQEAASAALLPEVPRKQPERVERERRSLWWVRRADARARGVLLGAFLDQYNKNCNGVAQLIMTSGVVLSA